MAPNLNNHDLVVLVRKAQKGDLEAFNAIYSKYYPIIFKYVLHLDCDRNLDDEGVVQETFSNCYFKLGTFKQPEDFTEHPESFIGWLYTIATNVYNNHWRKRFGKKKEATSYLALDYNLDELLDNIPNPNSTPEEIYAGEELAANVNNITLEEDAEVLWSSKSAIKGLRNKAYRRLAEELEKLYPTMGGEFKVGKHGRS